MVLFVDAPMSISGAACHLPDGDFILINRNEPSFRRHYDLGHELFHILTWEEMPPDKLDAELDEKEKPRVEKLADAFTAGVLLPTESVMKHWSSRPQSQEIHDAILDAAKHFRVSGRAMFWRLVNTGLLTQSEKDAVNVEQLSRPDDNEPSGRPNIYNADFVRRLHNVLQRGLVSARKASELLDCDPEDLKTICADYAYPSPICAPTPPTNAAAPC
jgi:Zn-dependent peptidase ImmA (M78 family)